MRSAMPMAILLFGAVIAAPAAAQQQTSPTADCKSTPAQVEEARKTVIAFENASTFEGRVALMDPGYRQHNPNFAKAAREKGLSDYEYLKSVVADFLKGRSGGAGGRGAAAGANRGRGAATGPQPPPSKLEVVMVECDLVATMLKTYQQDPTAPPGTFYESFAFDIFRVRNGKILEHWDHQLIPAAGSQNN